MGPRSQGLPLIGRGNQAKAKPVLQRPQDRAGLWRIPMTPEHPNQIKVVCDLYDLKDQVNSLYHLPSVKSRIVYIHASLGYPTKAAMMDAVAAGRFVGIHLQQHSTSTASIQK